jgi:hypothetical protein
MHALLIGFALMAPQEPDKDQEFVGSPVFLSRLIDVGVGPDLCQLVTAEQSTRVGETTLQLDERENLLVRGPVATLRNSRAGRSPFAPEQPGESGGDLRFQASDLRRGISLQINCANAQVAIFVRRDWRGVVWCPASGWHFNLHDTAVTYIDSNQSGHLDQADHVIYDGQSLAVPWHPWLIDGDTVLADLRIESLATLAARREAIPHAADQQPEVVNWNRFRLQHGVPPAVFAADRVEACEKHALYIGRHGGGHDEEVGKAGYSRDGREAGLSSCITYSGRNGAVERFLASLYHRAPLIDPDHFRLQCGGAGQIWLLGGIDNRAVVSRHGGGRCVQRFPAPGTSFPVGTYRAEHPRHPALDQSGALGLPVTLRFLNGEVPRPVSATLRTVRGRLDIGKVGEEVPCHLSYPNHNAPPGYDDLWQNVALTPLGTLKGDNFEAEFSFADGTAYRWRFRVGR